MKNPISILAGGVHIPPGVCELTAESFAAIWMEFVKSGFTYNESYELLERSHKKVFGHSRYSGYESFRRVWRRFVKNGTMSL